MPETAGLLIPEVRPVIDGSVGLQLNELPAFFSFAFLLSFVVLIESKLAKSLANFQLRLR